MRGSQRGRPDLTFEQSKLVTEWEAGDGLVWPTTSPVWSVRFPSVGALVTDAGGVLSHAAIHRP